jgi:hypothetical protein
MYIYTGELFFLYVLARSHSYASREATASDVTQVTNLRKALKIYNIVMNFKDAYLVEYYGNIVLDYAVCTAGLGEVSTAISSVRSALSGEKCSAHTSQLLHLLALLTACTGDDARVMGTSVALCKRASETSPSTAVPLTGSSAVPHHPHPDNHDTQNPDITDTDDITLVMNGKLTDLDLSGIKGVDPDDGHVNGNSRIIKSGSRAPGSVSVLNSNAGLSLAMLEWSSGIYTYMDTYMRG